MVQAHFDSSVWFRSIPLEERLASLKNSTHRLRQAKVDYWTTQRRLKRWQTEPPINDDEACYTRFLKILGISRPDFSTLLGEPSEQLEQRVGEYPTWLNEFKEAYCDPVAPYLESGNLSEVPSEQLPDLFWHLLKPFIYYKSNQLNARLERLCQVYPQVPLDRVMLSTLLLQNLPWALNNILFRTLTLELNIARLQGVLEGDTQEARFRSFIKRLGNIDAALTLFEEYPALARQTALTVQQWADTSVEFVDRLCQDWHVISKIFNRGEDLIGMTKLNLGLGDRHHGGRSVIIVGFTAGLKLVYKPRSVSADAHFQELLTWLNQRGATPDFRTLKVIARPDYGWIEYVVAKGCNSPDELYRFYQRQGGYLALLYTLDATDFHNENLLAIGEHPVLIDLEALFHPSIDRVNPDVDGHSAQLSLQESVLRVGILPQPVSTSLNGDKIRANGLGSIKGQLTDHGVPLMEGGGTDHMRIVRKRIEIMPAQNQPSLDSAAVDVLEYQEAILDGFTQTYDLLARYRDELLSGAGPVARFANDPVRVILRGTQLYGRLLQESYHPDLLRDCLDRDWLFGRLWGAALEDARYKEVVAAELYDLHRNDIPLFTTLPTSCHLWTSTGKKISDFLTESSMERVKRRLSQMGEKDLNAQLWLIKAALKSFIKEPQAIAPRPWNGHSRTAGHSRESLHDQLVEAACHIGDRLETLAFQDEDAASWLTVNFSDQYMNGVSILDFGFYQGVAGITLFLAYLGSVTGQDRYTSLAKSALVTLRSQIPINRANLTAIGGYSGWGGIIYTLSHLAAVLNQPALLGEAESLVAFLPELIDQDTSLDLIAGAAGCLAALLALHEYHPSPTTLETAVRCGDHLLKHARQFAPGIGWITIPGQDEALTGFSHGNAGMAWALLKLAQVTGDSRFKTAATEALRYERSHFLPEVGNWRNLLNPDKRPADQLPLSLLQWCHGAPGIGLARLKTLGFYQDEFVLAEIRAAVDTTASHGIGRSQCLCHGDLGNIELLLEASCQLDNPQWAQTTYDLAAGILAHIQATGWYCGVPMGVEIPGLMTGIAGIGFGLLRLAEPEQVPSVLTMAAPRKTRQCS
jgi:type 2 lantibiotic biosynthesis protein LanM